MSKSKLGSDIVVYNYTSNDVTKNYIEIFFRNAIMTFCHDNYVPKDETWADVPLTAKGKIWEFVHANKNLKKMKVVIIINDKQERLSEYIFELFIEGIHEELDI